MIATPALFAAVVYFGGQWLDGRFKEIGDQTGVAALTASTAATAVTLLNDRVDVIEANMASSSADRTQFQKQVARQIDKLSDLTMTTSNQLAAISATLTAKLAENGPTEGAR